VTGKEEVEEELGSEEEVGSSLGSWCSSNGSVSGGEGEGEGTAWSAAEVLPLLLLLDGRAAVVAPTTTPRLEDDDLPLIVLTSWVAGDGGF
jgi:hypothetical protein